MHIYDFAGIRWAGLDISETVEKGMARLVQADRNAMVTQTATNVTSMPHHFFYHYVPHFLFLE